MDLRIIKSPSQGTRDVLKKRIVSSTKADIQNADAVGLVQGKVIDMIVAADIAEKAAGVVVEDVRGSCPQNMITIALFGDTASVEDALEQIKTQWKEGKIL